MVSGTREAITIGTRLSVEKPLTKKSQAIADYPRSSSLTETENVTEVPNTGDGNPRVNHRHFARTDFQYVRWLWRKVHGTFYPRVRYNNFVRTNAFHRCGVRKAILVKPYSVRVYTHVVYVYVATNTCKYLGMQIPQSPESCAQCSPAGIRNTHSPVAQRAR